MEPLPFETRQHQAQTMFSYFILNVKISRSVAIGWIDLLCFYWAALPNPRAKRSAKRAMAAEIVAAIADHLADAADRKTD